MDTVRLSMGIQTVPARRALRMRLTEQLGGREGIERAVTRHMVASDTSLSGSAWPTARRVWASYDPEATHHLLLQDDAWVCDDFFLVLKRAIAAAPDAILVLCSERMKIFYAHRRGDHFMDTGHMIGVGIVMPAPMVDPFLSWDAAAIPPSFPPSDARVELFARLHGHELLTTVPNLVAHRDDGGTMLGHTRNPLRKNAACFEQDIGQRREAWVRPDRLMATVGWSSRMQAYAASLRTGRLEYPMSDERVAELLEEQDVPV